MDFLKGKKKADLDPTYKKAKMGVLGNLHDLMSKDMAGDLKGLKKVTVASNDDQGLAHGLDKAKELLGADDDSDEEGSEHEASESPEMEAHSGDQGMKDANIAEEVVDHEVEEGEMSPDEIDAMIAHLEAEKAKMMSKK